MVFRRLETKNKKLHDNFTVKLISMLCENEMLQKQFKVSVHNLSANFSSEVVGNLAQKEFKSQVNTLYMFHNKLYS
jgi:hypothetical protein